MDKKKLAYSLYLIVFVILFTEVGLRFSGYQPSFFQSYDNFETVDSLYMFRNYTTDEYGIYKFSSFIVDSVKKYYEPAKNEPFVKSLKSPMLVDSIEWGMDHVADVFKDFNTLVESETIKVEKSEFENFAFALFEKDSLSPFDSLALDYINNPFNQEGFRSVSFDSTSSKRKKILLLGDSFTYGQSANPLYNSYADILLARGNIVYNTGISGTDPAQYLAITKKYLTQLEPEVVVINFCLYNDFMNYPRLAKEEEPHEFITNAGFYLSSPEGKFLNAKEAYLYYQELNMIPKTSLFNSFMSMSAIGTQVWGKLYKLKLVKHDKFDAYLNWLYPGKEELLLTTKPYLEEIALQAQAKGIPVILVFVPDVSFLNQEGEVVLDSNLTLNEWKNLKYIYPENFVLNDFGTGGDVHFNNKGALKYANLIDSLIHNAKLNK